MNDVKIFKFYITRDFGVDFNFIFLRFKNYSVLQFSTGIFDYGGGPYFQVSLGQGRLLSILFSLHKFSFSIDLIGHNWPSEI